MICSSKTKNYNHYYLLLQKKLMIFDDKTNPL